jgi:glycosyltransferase involved in cell wall biosynthesis
MRAFYAELDLFCLSSLREGMPNVVLEAMAMSLPIVATSAGGLSTFLRDGDDALICPPGSAAALAEALRAAIRSRTRAPGWAGCRIGSSRNARSRSACSACSLFDRLP